MTITAYGNAALSMRRSNETFANLKSDLSTYQQQLASGKVAGSYSELGAALAPKSLKLSAQLSQLDSYQSNVTDGQLRLKLMSNGLQQVAKLSGSLATGLPASLDSTIGQTNAQVSAGDGLKQIIDVLNTDVNGRYLFAGRAADTEPVASYSEIMDGRAGQAGAKQVIAERRDADYGDGLGRLTVAATASTVTVAEDAANSPFGFKIIGTELNGANVSANTVLTSPATTTISVDALPSAGEKFGLKLKLPDGTELTVSVVAQAQGATPPTDGSVPYAIGATRDETATNIAAAVRSLLSNTADTALASASTIRGATDFFADPPQRVDGADPATATAAKDGSGADTLSWYRGDTSDPPDSPRDTAPVRVSGSQMIGTGAEANEAALRRVLANYVALDASSFPTTDPTSQGRYAALATRVSTNMTFADGTQSVKDMLADMSSATQALNTATSRIKVTSTQLQDMLGDMENADPQETATKLLETQTRLQASYQITSAIEKLSLVDYLG